MSCHNMNTFIKMTSHIESKNLSFDTLQDLILAHSFWFIFSIRTFLLLLSYTFLLPYIGTRNRRKKIFLFVNASLILETLTVLVVRDA